MEIQMNLKTQTKKEYRRLGFRVNDLDEKTVIALSKHLERSLSDTVRFAIRQTAREYGLLPAKKPPVVQKIKQQKVKT